MRAGMTTQHDDNQSPDRSPSARDARRRRSAARLAAVQALYQHSLVDTGAQKLMHEFHAHRFGEEIDGDKMADADAAFFDDIVAGVLARMEELDALITRFLGTGWTLGRLDRLVLQILRAGAYEMTARPDVPRAAVVSEYADVADAFYERTEVGFVNALLDRLGRDVRQEPPR